MEDKDKDQEVEQQEEVEGLISEDIDIEVAVSNDEPVIYVKFSGFEDQEDAEEYAEFLAETLPLLLYETTKIH